MLIDVLSVGGVAFSLTFLVLCGGGGLDLLDLVVDYGHDGESHQVHELKSESHLHKII